MSAPPLRRPPMDALVESITVPGQTRQLRTLHAFLGDFWERHRLPSRDAMRVELGLEEVFINVVTHGLGGTDPAEAPVTVGLRLADGTLEVAVEDPGPPFDPLDHDPLDPTVPADARTPGGLGIHLVRSMVDELRYERVRGRNRLVMVARLGGRDTR